MLKTREQGILVAEIIKIVVDNLSAFLDSPLLSILMKKSVQSVNGISSRVYSKPRYGNAKSLSYLMT